MSHYECVMRFIAVDAIKFPKEMDQFEGYLIAQMVIDSVITGGRDLRPGLVITVKGNMPSMHPAFRYQLRFKYNAPKSGSTYTAGDYEILPKAGFRNSQRIPWTLSSLTWSLQNEVIFSGPTPRSDIDRALLVLVPPGADQSMTIEEEALHGQFFYKALKDQSDYYRLNGIMAARKAYPGSIAEIRKMPAAVLDRLTKHLNASPHELCFYGHARHYGLGEMSSAAFRDIMDDAKMAGLDLTMTTKPLQMAAVSFYGHLKELRLRHGHTIFKMTQSLDTFSRAGGPYAKTVHAAMHWLTREGHLLFLDVEGQCLEKERWFEEPTPCHYLQFPRDDQLKERIVGHLRRIFKNFLEAGGKFQMRPIDEDVPAVPGGGLNERQRIAMDHILDNPITIIQGGPGSGKTFEGVDHLASIFQWTEFVTHVGRQAVALCDRLGGSTEIACTIHSAYFRQKDNPTRVSYNMKKEILILDEVYNADDWTFEKALALAPNASRLVMVGDPDQIRPIPDEKGAGTPALDIARAFPEHVIFLNENMRQLANAIAIHEVVTSIRTKQPRTINWSSDLDGGAAVLIRHPPQHSLDAVKKAMWPIIERLRRDIGNDEHAWQIVTFFNGTKPDTQGFGCTQINQFVEEYLDRIGYFQQRLRSTGKTRVVHKITNRLSMYVGFKFMITDKFIPHGSLNGGKLKKKSRGGMYLPKKRVTIGKKIDVPEPVYTDTKNGQIEVVAAMRQVILKGSRFPSWVIECVPKGKCVTGACILLNRKLHVDPSKIFSAWAVTTNKSMGGECKNVGVYIPPRIDSSAFDRSNLYVAVSRPINFLCVLGDLHGIDWLTMRDPKIIDSGLFTRLRTAKFAPEHAPLREQYETDEDFADAMDMYERVQGFDWKQSHNTDEHGSVVQEVKDALDVYDQSDRSASKMTIAACPLSYNDHSIMFKRELTQLSPEDREKRMKAVIDEYNKLVYAGIPNNARRFHRYGYVAPAPNTIQALEEVSDDGGEGIRKRHKPEERSDDGEVYELTAIAEGAFVNE